MKVTKTGETIITLHTTIWLMTELKKNVDNNQEDHEDYYDGGILVK